MAKSQPWSNADRIRACRSAACNPRRRICGIVAAPANRATPLWIQSEPAAPGWPSSSARKHGLCSRAAEMAEVCRTKSRSSGCSCDHAGALLRDAPKVLAVGDLHVGSFGTWRDTEGRLSWGVDDFDESY